MNTTQVLATSLLVTMIVALLGYSAISMLYHNPPMEAPVDITSSVLFVDCSKITMNVGSLRYDTLTSAYTILGLGAKNAIERQLVIDAIAPRASTITVTRLPHPIVLPPRSEAYREVLTPWANQSAFTRRVKPGDIYRVEGTSLTMLQSGPYFEHQGNVPVVDPPSNYNPPFKGNTRHQLQVSGTLMSSYISQPGYAATQLLSNAPRDGMLVLAHVKPEAWVEESDVPFYIDFYPGAQALAYRATKTISFVTGGSSQVPRDRAIIYSDFTGPDPSWGSTGYVYFESASGATDGRVVRVYDSDSYSIATSYSRTRITNYNELWFVTRFRVSERSSNLGHSVGIGLLDVRWETEYTYIKQLYFIGVSYGWTPWKEYKLLTTSHILFDGQYPVEYRGPDIIKGARDLPSYSYSEWYLLAVHYRHLGSSVEIRAWLLNSDWVPLAHAWVIFTSSITVFRPTHVGVSADGAYDYSSWREKPAEGLFDYFYASTEAPPMLSDVAMLDEAYIGVHLERSRSSLYLQDDTSPRSTAPPAATANVNLVVGLAREKEATSFIGYFSYDYYRRGHLDVFNYLNGYYEIWRDGSRIRSGYAPVFSNINYLKVTSGQYSAPFIIVYNPTRGGSDWVFNYETCWMDWRLGRWVCGVQRILLQRLNEPKQIESDFLVFWEDLIGFGHAGDNWNDLVVRITVFTDKTARIAVFMGYAGYAVDFYITIRKVNPIEGDYVFTKNFNTVVENIVDGYYREISNMIYYPSARIVPGYVSSHVYYIGAFRSPTLTVYGLFPGDVVVLATPNRAVSFEVDGSTLSVNLLTTFGPRELIEALKNGGVTMIIRPSTERILSLLPSEALVHVKGDWVDVWVPTTMLLSPRCVLGATGGSGTVVLERRGDFVRVTLTDGRTGSTVRFGTYARVDVDVVGFTMTISYQNGATETISPGDDRSGVTITPSVRAVFYGDRIILVAGNGIIEIERYSSVSISVSGSFSLRGSFGK